MMPFSSHGLIVPDWPAPENVKSLSTTRLGGVSENNFMSNNLALHVGDDPGSVLRNRRQFGVRCKLPNEPKWLSQTHSNRIIDCEDASVSADASYSHRKNQVCIVMTADCLPVLLCDRDGRQVAAVHAGWRGILNNVIENSLARFDCSSKDIIAWLGPAIGKDAFEVGTEVYEAFVSRHGDSAQSFQTRKNNKFLANIYGLARLRLNLAGIEGIFGGEYCTYSDPQRFYSYRRDGVCGRMASLIWLDK